MHTGVKDFVCINGVYRIPVLLDRCNGVLSAFLEADTGASSNLTEHIIFLEKGNRTSTSPSYAQLVSENIRDRRSVTGIVHLTAPTFLELNQGLVNALNGTRPYKFASFDFNRTMMKCLERGTLHYSVSGLLYIQTIMALMLLYVQVKKRRVIMSKGECLHAHAFACIDIYTYLHVKDFVLSNFILNTASYS